MVLSGIVAVACAGADVSADEAALPSVAGLRGAAVRLAEGVVEGTSDGATRTFIGIPYAAPPTGARRWQPPADVEPWSEPRAAVGPGVTCVQSTIPAAPGGPEQSEDCLTLDVDAPASPSRAALPVLVWFHGGSNRSGSANDRLGAGLPRLYDGARLRAGASREVIVVTVNYRLGVLGFFAHPALSREQGASGNYGLMDQQAALRWVQRNIAAFGGNPAEVTVAGESAGAVDIGYHLVARGSEALFQRAILESGVFGTKLPTLAAWEAQGANLAAQKGCPGSDAAALRCLRERDAWSLLPEALPPEPGGVLFVSANPMASRYWGADNTSSLANVDGRLIVEQPMRSYRDGRFVHVPMIVGSNAREASLFVSGQTAFADEAQLRASLERTYGREVERIAAAYPVARYPSANDAAIEIGGDSAFVCSAYVLARVASEHRDVFVYNWTRAAQIPGFSGYGATHAVELGWVWDWWTPLFGGPAEEVALARRVAARWVQFAATGDPNVDGDVAWPRYDAQTDPELVLDLEARAQRGRRSERCKLWAEVRASVWGDDFRLDL